VGVVVHGAGDRGGRAEHVVDQHADVGGEEVGQRQVGPGVAVEVGDAGGGGAGVPGGGEGREKGAVAFAAQDRRPAADVRRSVRAEGDDQIEQRVAVQIRHRDVLRE